MSELGDPDLLDEAEVLCRRAEALTPQLPQAPENLGNVLRLQGRLEEALACYKRSLERDPRRAMPCHYIGQLLQERGRYDEAARLYEAARCASRASRGSSPISADYRLLASSTTRPPGITVWPSRSTPRSPSSSRPGSALLEQSRLDEAETCFREALRIDPSLAASWVVLARL